MDPRFVSPRTRTPLTAFRTSSRGPPTPSLPFSSPPSPFCARSSRSSRLPCRPTPPTSLATRLASTLLPSPRLRSTSRPAYDSQCVISPRTVPQLTWPASTWPPHVRSAAAACDRAVRLAHCALGGPLADVRPHHQPWTLSSGSRRRRCVHHQQRDGEGGRGRSRELQQQLADRARRLPGRDSSCSASAEGARHRIARSRPARQVSPPLPATVC